MRTLESAASSSRQGCGIRGVADRKQLKIAPQIRGARRQCVLGQGLADGGEVIADEKRLAGAREIVDATGSYRSPVMAHSR